MISAGGPVESYTNLVIEIGSYLAKKLLTRKFHKVSLFVNSSEVALAELAEAFKKQGFKVSIPPGMPERTY